MNTESLDVNKWIRRAQMDMDSALILVKASDSPSAEVVCFLCQQAAEKILKAYTIAKSNTLTKTHDLVLLAEQCKLYAPDFDSLLNICDMLTSFVTASRYPQAIDIPEQLMKQALKDAKTIMDFTMAKLKEAGY